jgi:hypothetical protein
MRTCRKLHAIDTHSQAYEAGLKLDDRGILFKYQLVSQDNIYSIITKPHKYYLFYCSFNLTQSGR